jgi:hypothetical protein
MQFIAGVCRYCRCTEANPCHLPDGEACNWFDPTRTLCSAPACLAAHFRELEHERQRRAAPGLRRRSPAEIFALQKQEQRARRRRAYLARQLHKNAGK